MNRPVLAGAFGALVLIAASQGLAQSATQANPKAINAGTYKVEPYHTQVRFSVSTKFESSPDCAKHSKRTFLRGA